MILTLNKRTLLEDVDSSEAMTDTPPNSDGESVAEKLNKDLLFKGLLHKGQIDESEANRRAILSVTKRRFTDFEVTEETWNRNFETIVEGINRKVYENPNVIEVVHESQNIEEMP